MIMDARLCLPVDYLRVVVWITTGLSQTFLLEVVEQAAAVLVPIWGVCS